MQNTHPHTTMDLSSITIPTTTFFFVLFFCCCLVLTFHLDIVHMDQRHWGWWWWSHRRKMEWKWWERERDSCPISGHLIDSGFFYVIFEIFFYINICVYFNFFVGLNIFCLFCFLISLPNTDLKPVKHCHFLVLQFNKYGVKYVFKENIGVAQFL